MVGPFSLSLSLSLSFLKGTLFFPPRSLGVVLYELCTLEHAFPGQNLMSVMYKIVEGEKPQLPVHFNPSLRELFGR